MHHQLFFVTLHSNQEKSTKSPGQEDKLGKFIMMTYKSAIKLVSHQNSKIANLKDWRVPSLAARAIREIARTASAEEFIGTAAEMAEKFPTIYGRYQFNDTKCVAGHNSEEKFCWYIGNRVGRSTFRACDFFLLPYDKISE